jgi:hypothetical protein
MLAPTVDSDKTDAEGHRPRCEDEAALNSLGVAAPQAMKSPIATDHHGVTFSVVCDILYGRRVVVSKVSEGAPCQTYDKTSNGPHTVFLYQGYDIFFYCEAHCTTQFQVNITNSLKKECCLLLFVCALQVSSMQYNLI